MSHYLLYLFTKEEINDTWDVEPYLAPFRDACGHDLKDMSGVPLEFVEEHWDEELSDYCEEENFNPYSRAIKGHEIEYRNKNALFDWYSVGGNYNHRLNAKTGKNLFVPVNSWQDDMMPDYDATGRFDSCRVDDLINSVHSDAYQRYLDGSETFLMLKRNSQEEREKEIQIEALRYSSNWCYYAITSDFRVINNCPEDHHRYPYSVQEEKDRIQKLWDEVITPEQGNYVTVIDIHH